MLEAVKLYQIGAFVSTALTRTRLASSPGFPRSRSRTSSPPRTTWLSHVVGSTRRVRGRRQAARASGRGGGDQGCPGMQSLVGQDTHRPALAGSCPSAFLSEVWSPHERQDSHGCRSKEECKETNRIKIACATIVVTVHQRYLIRGCDGEYDP